MPDSESHEPSAIEAPQQNSRGAFDLGVLKGWTLLANRVPPARHLSARKMKAGIGYELLSFFPLKNVRSSPLPNGKPPPPRLITTKSTSPGSQAAFDPLESVRDTLLPPSVANDRYPDMLLSYRRRANPRAEHQTAGFLRGYSSREKAMCVAGS